MIDWSLDVAKRALALRNAPGRKIVVYVACPGYGYREVSYTREQLNSLSVDELAFMARTQAPVEKVSGG